MLKDFKFISLVLLAIAVIAILYNYNQKQKDNEESFETYSDVNQNSNYQTTSPPINTGLSNGGYLSKEDQVNLTNSNPNIAQNVLVEPSGKKCNEPSASEPAGQNEVFKTISNFDPNSGPVGLNGNQLPNDCYPKDQLTPSELLPQDPNSKWAQVNPSGQGGLEDQNFLNAGYHVGVNTVGQTLRNANYQLRSEPPNPQMKVSPWQQSTIEPDTNRRPMEIGGCE